MTFDHRPRKRFGQHFLRDSHLLQKISQAIHAEPNQHLVEIGPGEGVLTQLIVATANHLDLIEIDRDLVQQLQGLFEKNTAVRIFSTDVLKFDFTTLTDQPHSLRIIGNLPYNISSPLLFKLFEHLGLIHDMHFLLQKEVVLRMTANVGDPNYNRLSVMTQYFCDNHRLFDVSPSAFSPPPKVDSSFVRMIPRTPTVVARDSHLLSVVVRTAFNQRRKTLHNCLKTLIDDAALTALGIHPQQRPQQLSVDDFVKISNFLYEKSPRATV